MKDKKPFVICHVISSLDGRISGSTFELDETIGAMDEHWKIRADYSCEAVMNGSVTAAEIYAEGFIDEPAEAMGDFSKEDFVAETELDHYVVCVDPEGNLKWSRNYVDRSVQPKSHVIEVLLETVPDGYLEYLRNLGISYIFAGEDELDADLLMEKLVSRFGIKRLLITGGGAINWTMLKGGLIDEVSVIITPTVSGEKDVATMFDRPESSPVGGGVPMELLEARTLDGGSILLRCKPLDNAGI